MEIIGLSEKEIQKEAPKDIYTIEATLVERGEQVHRQLIMSAADTEEIDYKVSEWLRAKRAKFRYSLKKYEVIRQFHSADMSECLAEIQRHKEKRRRGGAR